MAFDLSLVALVAQRAGFALLAAGVLYAVAWVLGRLVFHPLAKYPGPKLAALTSRYEDFYEVYGNSNYDYVWKIKKMHQKYGPVVRVNPHEIHIDDPSYYGTLNSFQGKWDKDPHTAAAFANTTSSSGTVDHDLHKRRKAAIVPFFAKQKIYELEPVIVSKALQLCDRLEDYKVSGEVCPLRQALKCYATDCVAEYCFAKCGNMIDKPDFASAYWEDMMQGLHAGMRARFLPKWWIKTVKSAPAWIRASVGPGIENYEMWHTEVESSVDHIQEKKDDTANEVSQHRTVFHEILNSPYLVPEDKSRMRLMHEGGMLVGSGGETLAQVAGVIFFNLLVDKEKYRRLRAELNGVDASATNGLPSLKQLEALPYLTGVMKEGLRLRAGKVARQQRVPRGQALQYGDFVIEPGTICSMTPLYSHIDPSAFPDPFSFKPERWINISSQQRVKMESFLVPFSRGTRMCTAATLANAMTYIIVAYLCMKRDFDLYETVAEDIEGMLDMDRHYPLKGSLGLRVLVK